MNIQHKSIANRYLYDPLDRLTGNHSGQCFYNGTRIATEIHNNRKICFFEHEAMPLAEFQLGETVTLLATDQQTSVLNSVSPELGLPQSYSPYGYRPTTNGLLNLLGFNGEHPDPITGHYLLGQGYRAFNPVLMRFNSPDELSPFDRGGINSYTYCLNDPVNRKDTNGHFSISSLFKPFMYLKKKSLRTYYKLASSYRSGASSSLKNLDSEAKVIDFEDAMLKANMISDTTKITLVNSRKDLAIINDVNLLHKYILTQDNTLAIASITPLHPILAPSHASVARYISGAGANKEVISAGYLFKIKGGYQATNHSGHYRPTANRTTLTKFKLRSKGVIATSKNIDFTTTIRTS